MLTEMVESKIREASPDSLRSILDGWTLNGTYFCVLFCCVPKSWDRIMSAFSPLLDETTQDMTDHLNWIQATLNLYGKTIENLLFLVSDNTNSMPALAQAMGAYFIGCEAHRLALFVKKYLGLNEHQDYDDDTEFIDSEEMECSCIIMKIRKLMKKLRSTNKAGALRLETHLKPVISNSTRWSSVYSMISLATEPSQK